MHVCLLYSEEVPISKKSKLMDEKPTTSAKFILQKLPKIISKSNDRDVPLPSPFPLSQNYRADVAAALEAGQMTADTEKAFFSLITSAIFKYKKIRPQKTTLMWLLSSHKSIHFSKLHHHQENPM